MVTVRLTKNNVFHWHRENGMYAKGYLFAPDGKLYRDNGLFAYFKDITGESDFQKKLLSANGTFSIVVQRGESRWFAVDRFRYFPLFYRKKGNDLIVSDEINNLFDPNEQKMIDKEAYSTFSGLGYVLGNKTLLKDIFQIQAGEYIVYENNDIVSTFYHSYFSKIKHTGFDDAKQQLKNILQNIGQRMSQLLGDRPALLPLSGGFDSRLIAYLLKKEGIKNVLCFTYGKKEGNPEWERSKAVAEKLGFDWLFIDYTAIEDTQFHKQKRFIDFYTYTSQYVSKFGVTQYFAANYLTDEVKIPANSVRFPGHGGDFFSGAYFFPYMQQYKSISAIAKDLQYIRCNLIQLHRKEISKIKKLISKELIQISPFFHNVDNWVLKEIHSKYIINTNKLWEQRGIDNQMPLCDTELMDFFISLPFEYRINQKLYKTVLSELFAEFDINFPRDRKKQGKTIVQRLKVYIKRILPYLRKKQDIFRYDYFDFKRLSRPVLKELQEENRAEKIISMNGIFSEWYLIQIEKIITKVK